MLTAELGTAIKGDKPPEDESPGYEGEYCDVECSSGDTCHLK